MTTEPSTFADMDHDLRDIVRWGNVLVSLGEGDTDNAGELFVIGKAITDLGKRLEKMFDAAAETRP
jgi:hypothetical protein